ncbi:MAG: hypothetical protein MUO24_03580 [Desulfobacterales bacterium]|nr:hypothetical protein [Desulfobacterales bacterium]
MSLLMSSVDVAAIKAKTDLLPADPASNTEVDILTRELASKELWLNERGLKFCDLGMPVPGQTILDTLAYVGNSTVLAGTDVGGYLLRSVNFGLTWVNSGTIVPGEAGIRNLVYLGNGIVLAGTYANAHIARSVDYGDTWTDLGIIVGGEIDVTAFAYLGNGIVIAGTASHGHLLRSVNYGATWVDLGIPVVGENGIRSLAYLGNGIVVAGTSANGHLLRSTDYGLTWVDLGIPIAGENAYRSLVYLGKGIVIGGSANNGHVLRSTDYGLTWVDLGVIMAGETVMHSALYLGNGIVLMGTTGTGRIFRCTDYGLTWTDLGTIVAGQTTIHCLASVGNGIVVAGTRPNAHIARSDSVLSRWYATVAKEATVYDATQAHIEAELTEEHLHNREYWFGKRAPQTAINWGERASLAPYRAISGNNAFGTDINDEAQVIGSADTPIRVGSTSFDMRRIQILDVSVAIMFLLRVIHGTGTMAAAETAGQYTEITSLQLASPNGQAKPADIIQERIPVGHKVWIRAKSVTDNAWIDFLVGLHEYPGP